MPFELIEEVKKHPVPAALIAGGVVLGFLFLTGAFSGGSAATSTGGLDPATAQLYAQSQQLQAAQQAQTAQINGQQALATTQASYGLALAQIQANASTTQTNTAASVALAQITADAQTSQEEVAAQLQAMQGGYAVQTAGINAVLAGLIDTNALTGRIAELTAQEQLGIAAINSNTQLGISNNATQLGILTSNNLTAVDINQARIAGSVAKTQSNNALTGSLVNTGASALFAASAFL
jgi:hypothetical protein